ncbi:MAG: UvrD-helicase domain-containing protein [Desulfamplus sp.]|nr:UvrD-helicase domain-containing protein [Desulfamplus sp.]
MLAADELYKQNQKYISEEDFNNLKAPYIQKYKRKIIDEIEYLLKYYPLQKVDDFYKQNQEYLSENDFNNLKIIYIKKQIEAQLKLYKFEKADKLYEQNQQYISEDEFTNLRIIYTKKQINETIEGVLKSYNFEESKKIYEKNQQYISEDEFINLRTIYTKKQINEKIEEVLKFHNFEEADKIYEQNKQHISEQDFNNLKAPYIKQYTKGIIDEIKGVLKSYNFEEADKIYEQNQAYIPQNEYIKLKSPYEVRKQIQDYLESCQFEEADKLYKENSHHITAEFDAHIKNIIKQKTPELFSKKGLLFTNAILRQQSILSSKEYNPILNKELKAFFNQNLKNIPINEEQLEAIRELDTNVLLKARAGSGKTSVATLKTFFLISHEKIHPDHIMMLAFNKKAADEIENRIRKQYGIIDYHNARTFHSLAYQLVQPEESLLFDEGYQNVSTQKQSNMVQRLINEAMNPVFKANLYKFFRKEIDQLENIGEFLSKEDYYLYRRNYKYVTLRGDYVKSIGEKYIGDFLFEHGIKHRYEHIWFWDKKGIYRPDFSLFVNSKLSDMVIEFWGIDENDPSRSVPEHWTTIWFEYKDEMERKRNFWKERNNIAFIELSVADLKHATREQFEQILANKLMQSGIKIEKLSEEEIYGRLMIVYKTKLTGMFLQFIQKAKKQKLTPDDLIPKIDNIDNTKERVKIFSETANSVYRRYMAELKKSNYIDYDDLMERAINIVHDSKGTCSIRTIDDRSVKLTKLKYLFIDEYQDFSLLFYQLIDAIRQYNPSLKVFCVGDDWQAINAFAGSNLKFFNNFNDYIYPAEHKQLLTNFRSSYNLVDLANKFMAGKGEKSVANLNNKGEIYKCFTDEIFIEQRQQMENSNEKIFDKRFMTYIDKDGSMVQVDSGLIVGRILKACHSIITNPENIGKTVGILSRNKNISFHYDSLSKIKQKLKETCKDYKYVYPNFDKNIRVGTTHSFKGLEADIIIMLNVNKGHYPTIHPDNELYQIFGETQADILAEEARLFYVGITRAKTALYILCERENESEYLKGFALSEYKINYFYDETEKIMCSSPKYSNFQYTQDERKALSKSECLAAFYGRRR